MSNRTFSSRIRRERHSTRRPGIAGIDRAWLMSTAVFVCACSGDSRPLTEAVEAETLNLAELNVIPPAGAVEPLFIASGERVDLALQGIDTKGVIIEIDDTDRRWSVSDRTVASITDSGVLTGRAEGAVDVQARIAGIVADAFPVTVSNAALAGIDAIDGDDSLARCLPESYSTIGSFDDGSRRRLTDVEWSLGDSDSTARLEGADDGSVLLTARDAGQITLNVSTGGFNFSRDLPVDDTLDSVTIGPDTLTLEEDESLQLIATGTYTDGDTTSDEAITDNVDWRIVTGTDVASVGNSGDSRGLLQSTDAGVASVEAACGDIVAVREVVVSESSSSDGLVFEDGSDVLLRVGGAAEQLNVSTGSRYDEDSDVTNGTEFFIAGLDEGIISLSTTQRGLVTPLRVGEATVEARFGDLTARIQITVR